ncbi:vacuolar ATPase assembly protein VMA22-like [Oculina patagonica]
MEDVCSQLDQLTVEFFDNLERLQEKREYLNAAVRDGHLNLSKARYSMGNKSVGALQYSHRMDCALYHIEGCHISKDQSEDNCMSLEMKKTLPGKVIETSKADIEEKDDERNVLRRRKPQKSDSVNDEITGGIEELSLSKEDKLPLESSSNGCVQDPLKWFGILVPGCLRTGQKNFQSAIELSCEMVNLEIKLNEIIERFKALKARKRELILEEMKRSQDVEG